MKAALALLLFSSFALAQPVALDSTDLSRGVTLAPTSASLIDDATSIAINPGALRQVGGFQLHYLHERSVVRGLVSDGLYAGGTLLDALGLGISIDWVRGAVDYRKLSLGAALGPEAFSLGVALNHFASGENADLHGLGSFDLGLSGRLSRFISYGVVARNLDRPSRGAVILPREYLFSLGLRPPIGKWTERISLGVDYLFDHFAGLGTGRFSYVARGELIRGLTLGAGFSRGVQSSSPLALQLSLTLDSSNVGLTYAAGTPSTGAATADSLTHLVQVRLSGDKYRSVSTPKKVALFDLDDLLSERTNPTLALLGVGQDDPYLKLTRLIDGAIRDPNLHGIILKVNPVDVGLGKALELNDAIGRLRNAGKEVVAMVLQAGDSEYLAIAGCTKIIAVPGAMFLVDGFSATPLFAGSAFEKLGVSWDVARVGAFKNAPDLFTRSEMSPEQKEVINAYLDLDVAKFEQVVSRGRGLTPEKIRAAVAEGIKSPQRAKELGLIDEILGPSELEDQLPKLFPGARFDPSYRPRSTRDPRWGGRPKIAIVPVLGNIAGGRSRSDPLGLQQTAGAETFIRALQQAESDPDVAAIVVRVDSGGGDGLASDLMYRAVAQARKKKPVVASMGDVAASGGYYVAMGAEEIFQPTTLTGSIGVFFLKPALKGLAERLGLNQQTVRRGELAGLLNLYEPWGPAEKAAAQKWVDSFYDDFITEVARSRKMEKAKVDEVARGRVWSGQDAERVGLVDQMGGLLEAIDWARGRAGLAPAEEVEIALVGEPHGLLGAAAGEEGVLARLLPEAPVPGLPPGLADLARDLGLDAALNLNLRPELSARQEFRLEVR